MLFCPPPPYQTNTIKAWNQYLLGIQNNNTVILLETSLEILGQTFQVIRIISNILLSKLFDKQNYFLSWRKISTMNIKKQKEQLKLGLPTQCLILF